MQTRKDKRSRKVGVYNLEWELIEIYPSMSAAAKACGVGIQNVWKILNGYKSTLGGYNFKFLEEK